MTNANKNLSSPLKGTYFLIARKLGCNSKYVSRVLRGKLGKYNDRDTELVKKIRETAIEFEKMFIPPEQTTNQ
jgi:hypothetical protein